MVFKVSVCYFLSNFYFHQMISLQKLLKMFFISPNRHEKSPGTHGFPRFLFQLHINFFVCIKLPNSCIYAIKLRCVCVCVCVCVFVCVSLVVINFKEIAFLTIINLKNPKDPIEGVGAYSAPPHNPPAVLTLLHSLRSAFFTMLRRSSSFFINFCSHALSKELF